MRQMEAQAAHVGTKMIDDIIVSVNFSARPFTALGDSGDEYISDTVIICTGAQARWPGLPSEETFQGFGVSACATCDGFFYRGKEVLVIGGGNTAVEEAIYLTNHADKVTLIHRRDALRSEKILQERLFKNPKIEVIWDATLEEVVGDENPLGVTGAKIRNVKTDEVSDIAAHGVFIAIGHTPTTDLFKGQIEMDTGGYIFTSPDSTVTNVPGVFAAGDVQDQIYRQAVTAAGTGCMAALEVERYLSALEDGAAEAAE